MPVNKEFKSLYLQKDGISINGIAVNSKGDEIYAKEIIKEKNDKGILETKEVFWYEVNDKEKKHIDANEVKNPNNGTKMPQKELNKELRQYFARELSKLEAEMQLAFIFDIVSKEQIDKIHNAATNDSSTMTFRKPYFMREIRTSIDKVLESVGLNITSTKEEQDSDI